MWTEVPSPIGPIRLIAGLDALTGVFMMKHKYGPEGFPPEERGESAVLKETARQLSAYFEGSLRDFDLPLAPEGSDFQRQVWDELVKIPYGETISYLDLANRIKNPKAVRAVGMANGANPIAIIVPCHRVIGSNGSLTGFGGGLPNKRALLELEKGQRTLL